MIESDSITLILDLVDICSVIIEVLLPLFIIIESYKAMKPDTTIVETNYGPVRGIKRTSAVGDHFYSFRGIPYAKPPIGDLRFKVS